LNPLPSSQEGRNAEYTLPNPQEQYPCNIALNTLETSQIKGKGCFPKKQSSRMDEVIGGYILSTTKEPN
jgi:hypothetical protein